MAETVEPPSDRAAAIPLAERQLVAEATGEKLTRRIRQCSRSAFEHLRRAWRLCGVDDEISAFRAITAEEEAATALILALKHQQYPGAGRLNPWNHVHRSAFWPLFAAIGEMFLQSKVPAPQVIISKTKPPRVRIRLNMTKLAGETGEPLWIETDQPLNFEFRDGDASSSIIYLFQAELAALASKAGAESIRAYVEREANRRNRLLYASDDGLPSISLSDSVLLARARRVGILIILAVIVLQTPQHQSFVLQSLEALLHAIEAIGDTTFTYGEEEPFPELPRILIDRTGPEPAYISFTFSIMISAQWGCAPTKWCWPYQLVSAYPG